MVDSTYKVTDREGKDIKFASDIDGLGSHVPLIQDSALLQLLGELNSLPAANETSNASVNSLLRRASINLEQIFKRLPSTLIDQPLTNQRVPVVATPFESEPFTSDVFATTTQVFSTVSFNTRSYDFLTLQIQNIGTQALNAFRVNVDFTNTTAGRSLRLSTAADYTTNSGKSTNNALRFCFDSSGNLLTLPAGARGYLILNVKNVPTISLVATVSTGATTLRITSFAKSSLRE
jgi:hypothetical protein